MAKLTAEQKQHFLALTRRGWNRAAAAKEVGATGTQMKRMVEETCATYDHEFAVAYQQAITQIDPDGSAPEPRLTEWPQERTTTIEGFTRARFLTDEQLDGFLELVEQGEPRDSAARKVGTSLSQINRRAAHDKPFAERLEDAYQLGYPVFQDRLRALIVRLAEDGDYRAARDLGVVHLPEFATLKTTRHEVGGIDGGAIRVINEVFPGLPLDVIDNLIAAIESKQIEASKVIDMIPRHATG